MERLSALSKQFLGSLGPEAAKMMRIQQIKERYRVAVKRTWRDNPAAADWVLAHTNGMYVAKDDRLRTGPDKHKDRIIFGVYLDDPVVRTEFDARQQLLAFALRQEGMSFDELRILPAKWDMRQRRAFPEYWGEQPAACAAAPAEARPRAAEDVQRLDILKKAVCLAFEDADDAWAVLERIEGAGFDAVRAPAEMAQSEHNQAYWCHVYVEDPTAMKAVLTAHGEAIKSKAYRLGLRLRAFVVHQATPSMAGLCAFRRTGHSVPLTVHPSWATESKSARSSR